MYQWHEVFFIGLRFVYQFVCLENVAEARLARDKMKRDADKSG